jgi:hypothetical protein
MNYAEKLLRRSWPRAVCPLCKRSVSTYVPKGGDGSVRLLRNHKDATASGDGMKCAGSKQADPTW